VASPSHVGSPQVFFWVDDAARPKERSAHGVPVELIERGT